MNNPIDLSQMLKAKTSTVKLNQKLNKLKINQDKKNNRCNAGEDLKKVKPPEIATVSGVQEPVVTMKVNKLSWKTNPGLVENISKIRGSLPIKPAPNKVCVQKKEGHKKTLENMAKLKFHNPHEPHPIGYDSELILNIDTGVGDTTNLVSIVQPKALKKPTPKRITYYDQHIINILHTKVSAHTNGFFANSLPGWFEKTFDKSLPPNWMDLVLYSQNFFVEHVQNQVVLYGKESEKSITDSSAKESKPA